MEFILIHKMRDPDIFIRDLDLWKKALTYFQHCLDKPEDTVAGGKLAAAYVGRVENLMVHIWEAPNAEALVPHLGQMFMLGFDTDLVLAESSHAHLKKALQYLETMTE